ncbi:hypothetical protein CR198_12715 [Enterococcus faecium]|nr:hypothetical protein CR198_12715 [Enterococcus faecium]
MNQKTSKVEKEFYLRCSYLTLSVLFDKEPFLFGGDDFIPLIISVEFNREAWRLLRNTFLDERQFF